MFIDNIKQIIASNPQIVMVTNRGLETADRKIVFMAKDLDKRYPELKSMFHQDIESKPIEELKELPIDIPEELAIKEVVETIEVVEKPKKKSKKK